MSGKWDNYSEYCITHPKTNKQKQRKKWTSENVSGKNIVLRIKNQKEKRKKQTQRKTKMKKKIKQKGN